MSTFCASLRDDGTAILLVTHDLGEARQLGDRLVIMVAGRVRMSGALSDLIARDYAHIRQVRVRNPRFADSPGAARLMEALGLQPGNVPNSWHAVLKAGDPALTKLFEAMTSHRLQADEIVVKQPDLGWLLEMCIRDAQEHG